MKLNVLSLFGGVECSYPSFEELGIEVGNYYTAEIDEHAISITRYNIPKAIHLGDVTGFDFTTLKGKIDIVIGGSPCTYWSISKKDRETTSDGIGYELFMHYVRAVRETGAKYFVYENNFSIHKDIKDAITKELGVELIMLNSSLVSAQNRRRCYWTNLPVVGEPKDKGLTLASVLEESVDKKYYINQEAVGRYMKNGKPKGYKLPEEKAGTVTATVHKGYGNDGCTVVDNKEGGIRRLTPLEYERLQTLPNNWTKYGINKKGDVVEISDTQRLKCIGNGWTKDIFTFIYSFIPR